jgi:Helix-turn-helix domain
MNQTNAILAYLQSGATLTPLEALDKFGCLRLGARIDDLRKAGHAIETRRVQHGRKWWAEYSIAAPQVSSMGEPNALVASMAHPAVAAP